MITSAVPEKSSPITGMGLVAYLSDDTGPLGVSRDESTTQGKKTLEDHGQAALRAEALSPSNWREVQIAARPARLRGSGGMVCVRSGSALRTSPSDSGGSNRKTPRFPEAGNAGLSPQQGSLREAHQRRVEGQHLRRRAIRKITACRCSITRRIRTAFRELNELLAARTQRSSKLKKKIKPPRSRFMDSDDVTAFGARATPGPTRAIPFPASWFAELDAWLSHGSRPNLNILDPKSRCPRNTQPDFSNYGGATPMCWIAPCAPAIGLPHRHPLHREYTQLEALRLPSAPGPAAICEVGFTTGDSQGNFRSNEDGNHLQRARFISHAADVGVNYHRLELAQQSGPEQLPATTKKLSRPIR
jgi:hypothetical protein